MESLLKIIKRKKFNPEILVFSDLHLHDRKELSIQDETLLIGSRFLEGISILQQINTLVRKLNVRYVLFLGDWFEIKDRIPTHMLYMCYEEIKNICGHVEGFYSLIGNHDFNRKQYPTPKLFDSIKIFHVLDYPYERFNLCGRNCTFIPFYRDWDQFKQVFDKVNNSDFIFMHQEIPGVFPGSEIDMSFMKKLSDHSFYISGHIHKGMLFHKILFVGSPYQVWFSEAKESKFIYLFDFNTMDFLSYELDSPRFVEIDLKDIDNKYNLDNCYVKVKGEITDTDRRFLDKNEVMEKIFKQGAKNVIFDVRTVTNKNNDSDKYKNISITNNKEIIDTYIDDLDEIKMSKKKLKKIGLELIDSVV